MVKRISDVIILAINVHANFYLQYVHHTYIKVYSFEEKPLLLLRYDNDKLVLM